MFLTRACHMLALTTLVLIGSPDAKIQAQTLFAGVAFELDLVYTWSKLGLHLVYTLLALHIMTVMQKHLWYQRTLFL